MLTTRITRTVLTIVTAALMAPTAGAGVDVKVDYNKAYGFTAARTWTWNAAGAGDVKMARTQQDDPEAMRQRVEPIIVDAVGTEMERRGLKQADESADLTVTYYLLLTVGASAQTLGQFVPATPEWGLPPFAAATQSIEVMNQGSLVLDLSAGGEVVWRGVASARVSFDTDDKTRAALLRTAVRDLLRRYPRGR
jgi:hypothetical protein